MTNFIIKVYKIKKKMLYNWNKTYTRRALLTILLTNCARNIFFTCIEIYFLRVYIHFKLSSPVITKKHLYSYMQRNMISVSRTAPTRYADKIWAIFILNNIVFKNFVCDGLYPQIYTKLLQNRLYCTRFRKWI